MAWHALLLEKGLVQPVKTQPIDLIGLHRQWLESLSIDPGKLLRVLSGIDISHRAVGDAIDGGVHPCRSKFDPADTQVDAISEIDRLEDIAKVDI